MPQKPRIYRALGGNGRKPARKPQASAHKRGYTQAWRVESKAFLKDHPFCECDECKGEDLLQLATCVDHIIPHRGDEVLFWERSNWQAMTSEHHSRKTAKEDGAFGHQVKERGRG